MEFEATIEFTDPMLSSPSQVLRKLNEVFSGACYKGAFIENVTRVIQRSPAYIIKTNTTGSCYVDVKFLAKVVIFNQWDIITGVEIVSNQQMLTGKYEDKAVITVLPSKGVERIPVGCIVPIRVSLARHTPLNKAVVVGTIFAAEKNAPKLAVSGMLETSRAIEHLYGEIKKELDLRKDLDHTKVEFFEDLLTLNASKTESGFVGGFASKTESMLEIAKGIIDGTPYDMTGIWTRPLGVRRSSDIIAKVQADPQVLEENSVVLNDKPATVFANFLKSMHDYLKAIREMCHQYDDLKKYELLWRYMRECKTLT